MRKVWIAICITIVVGSAWQAHAAPVGKAFTYQGKLTDSSGNPVNGTADFRFTLWDAATDGTQIAGPWDAGAVTVSGGLFTVTPDFGVASSAFDGSARWLQIEARTPSGSGSYQLLGPRQQINAVPYAQYSLSAAPGDAETVDGFHARPIPYANSLLPLNDMLKFPNSVLYMGAGNGLDADLLDGQEGSFYLNAGNLTGSLSDSLLSSNVALLNTEQVFTADKYFTSDINMSTFVTLEPIRLIVENQSSTKGARGIYAQMSDSSDSGEKLFAIEGLTLSANTSKPGAGVYGEAIAGTSAGVRGDAWGDQGTGVLANAFSGTGSTYALKAECSSSEGWAGHFTGRGYFSGNVGIGTTTTTYPLTVENPSSTNFSRAIYGLSSDTGSTGMQIAGVFGETKSTTLGNPGAGVVGWASSSTGLSAGVRGDSASSQGTGVYASAYSPTGTTYALKAVCSSPTGWAGYFTGKGYFSGTLGVGTQNPEQALGVWGGISLDQSNGNNGTLYSNSIRFGAVSMEGIGSNRSNSGAGQNQYGLDFYTNSFRRMSIAQGGNVGIGTTSPSYKLHVEGSAGGTDPIAYVVNTMTDSDAPAIRGEHNVTAGWGIGVEGVAGYIGVKGDAQGAGSYNRYGVYGYASGGADAIGVYGTATGGSNASYAGFFNGNVYIGGTLSGPGKSFKIDHPLDPESKYLTHFCVEGPEMMNVYSGNVTTGGDGYATVQLPDYFEAANKDFRYQLTVVDDGDDFVLAKVVSKVKKNQFTIRTSRPNVEVSWQVTGIRDDKWARKNAVSAEQEKPSIEKGKYLHPEVYGKSREFGIGYVPAKVMRSGK